MNKENLLTEISKMSENERELLSYDTSDVEILNILAEDEKMCVRKGVASSSSGGRRTSKCCAR